jgi:hypothetical protein
LLFFFSQQIRQRTITETEYKADRQEKVSPLFKPEIKLWKKRQQLEVSSLERKRTSFALNALCMHNYELCFFFKVF